MRNYHTTDPRGGGFQDGTVRNPNNFFNKMHDIEVNRHMTHIGEEGENYLDEESDMNDPFATN